jgi:putative ABC transport system permease protein
MAWREARASAAKFAFVIFGVAAGVGALTGVRGFSAAFHDALRREARTLMAGDLMLRQFATPSPAQLAQLEPWMKRGVRLTRITETVSMMSAGRGSMPILISLKAVDPRVYPFYGRVRLEPDMPLDRALIPQNVAVSEDLLVRLNIAPGATVRLGAAEFTVVGIVQREPDRMTGSFNVGPRVLISRDGLERTGLLVFGSRASQRLLFRLPAQGVDVVQFRDALRKAFPESLVADYREGHPFITSSLERSTTFLSLVSLIALIVGALGVATAIYSHIQQRLDTIAILKCLGARSAQIIRIYTLQTLLLGIAGGLAGIAVGAVVQKLFPLLLARYFQIERIPWSPSFALEGIAAGVLVTLLFTVPPLLAVRQVKPALIFRRDMAESRPAPGQRLRKQFPAIAAGALILTGLGGIAAWLADSPRMGAYFIGGLAAAFLVLGAVAWLLLRGLRLFLRWSPVRLPVALRHGMANLYRPGNHAGSVLVALGIGVMFTLTIYLVQKSLLVEVAGAAPPGAPNVYLINITPADRDAVARFLNERKDLQGKPRLVPLVPARLLLIDGKPLDRVDTKHDHDRHWATHTRQVTWVEEKPDDTHVLRGAWWHAGETAALVSVSEHAAANFGIKPGMTLRWQCFDRDFDVRVAAIHRTTAVRMQDTEFLFNHAALAGFPSQWFGTARIAPKRVAAFQRDAFERFPSVTVVNAADILAMIQEVVDQVALVVRFISAFAILASAIILASTVAGTRLRRAREAAVLKTLGARRARLISIFSVEFAILGAVAGLMGGALATAFSRLLLTRLLDAKFQWELLPNLTTILLTAGLALATGWLASLRILRQRPLEVLRDE